MRNLLFTFLIFIVLALTMHTQAYSQCCSPTSPNLIVDGSFENTPCSSTQPFYSDMTKRCINPWIISSNHNGVYNIGDGSIQAQWQGYPRSGNYYFVGDGLWGTSSSEYNVAWSQEINVTSGKSYVFKIYYFNEQLSSAPIGLGFNTNPIAALSNTNILREWTPLCAIYHATYTGILNAKIYKYSLQSAELLNNDFGIDDIEIREIEPFEIADKPNVTICKGDNVTLQSEVYSGSGSYSYSWSSGQNTQNITISPASTQTYKVTITDLISGCSKQDDIRVNVIDLKSNLSPSIRLCQASPNIISVQPSGGSDDYSYLWSTGGVNNFISLTYTQTGDYSVTVTDNIYGCTVSDTITTTQWDCQGIKYYQNTANLPTMSYYNNIAAGRNVSPLMQEGNVTVQNGQNITFKGSQSIILAPGFTVEPNGIFSGYIEPGCIFEDGKIVVSNITHCSYKLSAQVSFGSGNYSYNWSTGSTNRDITVSPTTSTTYSVTITDNCLGNYSTISHTINPPYFGDFTYSVIPNLVTPNNDGYNDSWVVQDGNKTQHAFNAYGFDLIISNKWGSIIWAQNKTASVHSTGFAQGDLFWPANNVSDDVYYFNINFKNCTYSSKDYKGWVQVLGSPLGRKSLLAMDTSSIIHSPELSAIEQPYSDLIIYPNPSNGPIKLSTKPGTYHMSLEDLSGRTLHNSKIEVTHEELSLNFEFLSNGSYIIRLNNVQNKEEQLIKRLIIQK
jgi:hypothetical protein